MITYAIVPTLGLEEARELYRASTLGERRPIDDDARFGAMLKNANLIIVARDGPLLVGIARSLTDFAHSTYLADLAVRTSHQRKGIGKELMRLTQEAGGLKTSLILLSAPAAVNYYPKVGFTNPPSAWWLKPGDKLV
jgi:ribosomal protein S18 acetylase RimI-like enzyme